MLILKCIRYSKSLPQKASRLSDGKSRFYSEDFIRKTFHNNVLVKQSDRLLVGGAFAM
ncbi:hypothetical protein Pse7429DRAFT_2196 [Pseudanabaena biceps PCC 7429]|uniref:Uncharacterized protein n=1 Tax=Pseudanabaena biceps PCC 7429 TaxID=927668 RepID=L8N0V7_9CYAN|nr:hypothetical protein Pse7429DRAFT_2196 [Pseudanabaena biceps PCC 7429]